MCVRRVFFSEFLRRVCLKFCAPLLLAVGPHVSWSAATRRLKHAAHGNNSADQLGICFYTVEVKDGNVCSHQSTLVVTAEDRHGVPYAWSGQEFRGEVVRKKAQAEIAAARAFLNNDAVQRTAANMDPAYAYQPSPCKRHKLTVWERAGGR